MSGNVYECFKCKKLFNYKSKLDEHHNRKKSCVQIQNNYNCKICNCHFNFKSDLERHEKSKKHINNYNVHIENLHIHMGDQIIINGFTETNLSILNERKDIEEEYLNNKKLMNHFVDFEISEEVYASNNIFADCINYFIKIFSKLHFNLAFSENHNCKFLSFTIKNLNKVEYQLLTLDSIMKTFSWEIANYDIFIELFINLIHKIDTKFNNQYLKKVLDYVNKYKHKYLLNDDYTKYEIEKSLLYEYNEFNKVQKNQSEADALVLKQRAEYYRELELDGIKKTQQYRARLKLLENKNLEIKNN